MRKNYIVKLAVLIPLIGIFASCTNKNQFTVEGIVKDGAGKMLYFENITTSSIVGLDSVKISKSGSFKFKQEKPVAPDFYRLRLNHQFVNLTVDSVATIVKIQSDTIAFARNYTIEGSTESEKIKELTFLQLHANEAYSKLLKQFTAKTITADEYVEKIQEITGNYKKAALEYIYTNPSSASAYFALFQQINGLLIFDPYDKADSKAFGAVANNWNQYYPNAPRTKHLVSLFATSLKVIRGEKPIDYQATELSTKDFFDISLPSIDDKEIRLSEVGQGKVVLVDFIAYGLEASPLHNRKLNEFYEKYQSQGLLIYQVALDPDKHFWKNAAANLPWICVIDPQSVNSEIAKKYNVTDLPTAFIMNREGEIVGRIENYDDLGKELAKNFK
jgi:thiol-disulfide isomerase/thioredoxin